MCRARARASFAPDVAAAPTAPRLALRRRAHTDAAHTGPVYGSPVTSTARLLAQHPVHVWQIDTENEFKLSANPALSALEEWATAVMIDSAPAEGAHWVTFRGVPLARLADVLRTGIDVTPTDAPIFCTDGVDKAFEYARPAVGETGPGLILALRGPHLERTFRDLDADASPAEIATARETYPHPAGNPGGRIRFSRLADQTTPGYEEAYGYWIPGNAREALIAVSVLGQGSEVDETVATALAVGRADPLCTD